MQKVFEDEFMDLQSDLISLCLEVAEQRVNKVYAYCSVEEYSRAFNAFFEVGGEIRMLHQMGLPDRLTSQFLSVGTHDLDKIEAVCVKHDRPIPREIKMCYDVDTGKFDAWYKYEPVCTADTEKDIVEVFLGWVDEVKSSSEQRNHPRRRWGFGRKEKE